jgi:hypothetical protein
MRHQRCNLVVSGLMLLMLQLLQRVLNEQMLVALVPQADCSPSS